MSYTKGPLTVERKTEIGLLDGPVEVFEVTQKADPYADFSTVGYTFTLEDAELLAAAPEMVEALETAKRALDRLAEIDQIYLNDTYAQIVKALTKAKGGQP